jgi:3-oxoacyl-[acyl-carrier-protein] synthase II
MPVEGGRMAHDGHQVAVTGIGLVSPLGHDPETAWSRVLGGRTAIRPLADYPSGQGGAVVEEFDAAAEVNPKRILKMVNRSTALALAAARRAWRDSGLAQTVRDRTRVGLFVGAGESEMRPEAFFAGVGPAMEQTGAFDLRAYARSGLEFVDPYVALTSLANNALCYASVEHQLMGPNNTYVKSGVASSQALGEAMWTIRHGYADAVLVVGVDCLCDPLAVASYESAGLLCEQTSGVEGWMRPFDRSRCGFMPGEGAGALVLERSDHARERGARILGRVLGFGQAMDTFHLLDTPPDGGRLPIAIATAIDDAGLVPEDLDFLIAHGNATPRGDDSEAAGIAAAAGGTLTRTPITATKPVSGHLGAASGAVEAIFALHMLRDRLVPPVLNLQSPDSAAESLNLIRERPHAGELEVGVHVARGIGGQNAVLVLGSA